MRDYQSTMIREAMRLGIDPADMSVAQYERLALAVRPLVDKVRDGVTAIESYVATSVVGHRRVSLDVIQENESACRTADCGRFRLLGPEKRPACDWCLCSGSLLESKWADSEQSCPHPRKFWDNRGRK